MRSTSLPNVDRTKIINDFETPTQPKTTSHQQHSSGSHDQHKVPGVHIPDHRGWSCCTASMVKTVQRHLQWMRRPPPIQGPRACWSAASACSEGCKSLQRVVDIPLLPITHRCCLARAHPHIKHTHTHTTEKKHGDANSLAY